MAGAGAALSPYDATQKMNEGNAVFLDVRDESEYKGGHLLNSLSMPVSKLAERMHEVDKFKDKEIVVYCDNGMRASRAMGKLKKNGCTQLFSLAGGLQLGKRQICPQCPSNPVIDAAHSPVAKRVASVEDSFFAIQQADLWL